MSFLPKIHIDNLEGDTNDLRYNVGNIDLGGFKLQKEKVTLKVNIAEDINQKLKKGYELISFHAWGECIK